MRKGKIYLDYLQNRKAQTLVAPYCVRPVRKAPVATPVEWNELKKGLHPTDHTIHTVVERIKKRKDIFKPLLKEDINIAHALQVLGES